jgi:uncharacterized protein (DUF433 family)
MSTVVTAPIEIDEEGVAWLTGTRVKVIEVALDHLAHGWSPEEIFFQHYGQLSMAQIHAALSFYYAHQSEFDAEIAKNAEAVRGLRAGARESPGRKRLRDLGHLP